MVTMWQPKAVNPASLTSADFSCAVAPFALAARAVWKIGRAPGPGFLSCDVKVMNAARFSTWAPVTTVPRAQAFTKWTVWSELADISSVRAIVSCGGTLSLAAERLGSYSCNGTQMYCRSCCCQSQTNSPSAQSLKAAILEATEGTNRGIFGVTSNKKTHIEGLLQSLEALNPSPRPTDNLDMVNGEWKLLYSTIAIRGANRTKLGLRDFINFGDFRQIIDVNQKTAINKIGFSVVGLGMLNGALTIEASYSVSSPTRVDIQLESSSIKPDQLLTLFKRNYDLLLSIFNPSGWLEITYVDDTMRVGRDNKGNVFVVERTLQT